MTVDRSPVKPIAQYPARPHVIYLAWGFPPAAKSCAYRMLATANAFYRMGWDITVVTLTEDAWRREYGVDHSLAALVEPGIDIVRLPLLREDLETDIRRYSHRRASEPAAWLAEHRREDERDFPEPVFGRWRGPLTEAVFALHRKRPADLVLASATPYTFFAPALDLHDEHGVPFVLDYRDAWAIDIIGDRPAFGPDSRPGRIEATLMAAMSEAWFVNTPIRDAYAQLYPRRAADLHVVRNGSDLALGTDTIPIRPPTVGAGLVFGYLGTVTFPPERTRAICQAWQAARRRNDVLARSQLVFRGHLGAGSAKGVNAHASIIDEFREDGITYAGPIDKGATAALYASWDVLVLALVGGRYVTSGKVYDYISTGLPVLSVHEREHAATEVLGDYPLWVAAESLDVDDITRAFITAAEVALNASDDDRRRARDYAHRFERYAQIEPAVQRISATLAPGLPTRAGSAERRPDGLGARSIPTNPAHEGSPAGARKLSQTVVAVATTVPSRPVQVGMERLRTTGARVVLVLPQRVDLAGVDLPVDETILVPDRWAPVRVDPRHRPVRWSPRWFVVVATNLTRKVARRTLRRFRSRPESFASSVRRHPGAHRAMSRADIITALDQGAVYPVWLVGRSRRRAHLVNGVGPTLDLLRRSGG